MSRFLIELIRPFPTNVSPASLEELTRRGAWPGFCGLLHWSGLAPLAHTRLRHYRGLVPDDILKWLQVQYYQRIGRNRFLLEELRTIVEEFASAGIEVMILKGHASAHFSRDPGRVFGDLDLLVKPNDVPVADRLLVAIGYKPVNDAPHPFHYRYIGMKSRWPVPVELHFDICDNGSRYSPDVAALWNRSVVVSIFGLTGRVPDLTDHLLLVILQLPDHHWALRLIADVGQVIWARKKEIDWERFLVTARAWGMRALAGSALHVVSATLRVALPHSVKGFVEPENYFRRVQWRIAEAAVSEKLNGRRARISRLARSVFEDRWEDVPSLLVRKVVSAAGRRDERTLLTTFRSVAAGAAMCPELILILLKSVLPLSYVDPGMALQSDRPV